MAIESLIKIYLNIYNIKLYLSCPSVQKIISNLYVDFFTNVLGFNFPITDRDTALRGTSTVEEKYEKEGKNIKNIKNINKAQLPAGVRARDMIHSAMLYHLT